MKESNINLKNFFNKLYSKNFRFMDRIKVLKFFSCYIGEESCKEKIY